MEANNEYLNKRTRLSEMGGITMGILDGLFGGQKKQIAAENELKMKMSRSPFVEGLVAAIIQDQNNQWIVNNQGGEDDGHRMVSVENNRIVFEWSDYETIYVNGDYSKDPIHQRTIYGEVYYYFKDSGFEPLRGYTDSAGTKLSSDKVVHVLCELVREKMMERIPGLVAGKISCLNYFGYSVPERTLKSMF